MAVVEKSATVNIKFPGEQKPIYKPVVSGVSAIIGETKEFFCDRKVSELKPQVGLAPFVEFFPEFPYWVTRGKEVRQSVQLSTGIASAILMQP